MHNHNLLTKDEAWDRLLNRITALEAENQSLRAASPPEAAGRGDGQWVNPTSCPHCGRTYDTTGWDEDTAAVCEGCHRPFGPNLDIREGAIALLGKYRAKHKECVDLTGHPDALKSQRKDWRCDLCKEADVYTAPPSGEQSQPSVNQGEAVLGTCADFPTTPHPEGTCEACDMWKPLAHPPKTAAPEKGEKNNA